MVQSFSWECLSGAQFAFVDQEGNHAVVQDAIPVPEGGVVAACHDGFPAEVAALAEGKRFAPALVVRIDVQGAMDVKPVVALANRAPWNVL